jgi:hypothetical protein
MEHLIWRAVQALGTSGVTVQEAAEKLISTGVSKEDAFLAIRAAEILMTPWVSGERMTLPEIPASKRPDSNE